MCQGVKVLPVLKCCKQSYWGFFLWPYVKLHALISASPFKFRCESTTLHCCSWMYCLGQFIKFKKQIEEALCLSLLRWGPLLPCQKKRLWKDEMRVTLKDQKVRDFQNKSKNKYCGLSYWHNVELLFMSLLLSTYYWQTQELFLSLLHFHIHLHLYVWKSGSVQYRNRAEPASTSGQTYS